MALLQRKSETVSRSERMATEPIPKLIPAMALPAIIAFLINSIYSLADTFFVSSLGTNATAAVSVNSSLDMIIMMTGSLFAVGAASYIARLLGAGKKDRASDVLSTSWFSVFFIGIILMAICVPNIHPLVRMLGATESCETYAVQYATYVLLVAPFMGTSFVMNQCLRSEGAAMRSMIGMSFGGILNCVLDPIFIFKLDLGVAGASMATAISKVVSFCILIYPYIAKKSELHLTIRRYRFDKIIFKEVLSVGASSLFRSGLMVVSGIILNRIAGGISDSVLAGIGVCQKLMMFPFGVILGIGTGFTPVAGFNFGACKFDRVRESFRFVSIVSVIVAIGMALVIGIPAHGLIHLFSAADGEMMRIGALAIRTQCITMPIHAWVAMVNMYSSGLGDAKGAFVLATARQGTCFLPIVFPMTILWGAIGVGTVQAVADGLTILLALPVLSKLRKKVNAAEQAFIEEKAARAAAEAAAAP